MKDIKVIDTLKEIEATKDWYAQKHSPIEWFAEAVSLTRTEQLGVTLVDIAKVFKKQLEKEELQALIYQLQK